MVRGVFIGSCYHLQHMVRGVSIGSCYHLQHMVRGVFIGSCYHLQHMVRGVFIGSCYHLQHMVRGVFIGSCYHLQHMMRGVFIGSCYHLQHMVRDVFIGSCYHLQYMVRGVFIGSCYHLLHMVRGVFIGSCYHLQHMLTEIMDESAGGQAFSWSPSKTLRSPRRPLKFWAPLNDWWRSYLLEHARKPQTSDLQDWYNEHSHLVWSELERPSWKETRVHAKCLRSTEQVKRYFREYRAKKHVGVSGSAPSITSGKWGSTSSAEDDADAAEPQHSNIKDYNEYLRRAAHHRSQQHHHENALFSGAPTTSDHTHRPHFSCELHLPNRPAQRSPFCHTGGVFSIDSTAPLTINLGSPLLPKPMQEHVESSGSTAWRQAGSNILRLRSLPPEIARCSSSSLMSLFWDALTSNEKPSLYGIQRGAYSFTTSGQHGGQCHMPQSPVPGSSQQPNLRLWHGGHMDENKRRHTSKSVDESLPLSPQIHQPTAVTSHTDWRNLLLPATSSPPHLNPKPYPHTLGSTFQSLREVSSCREALHAKHLAEDPHDLHLEQQHTSQAWTQAHTAASSAELWGARLGPLGVCPSSARYSSSNSASRDFSPDPFFAVQGLRSHSFPVRQATSEPQNLLSMSLKHSRLSRFSPCHLGSPGGMDLLASFSNQQQHPDPSLRLFDKSSHYAHTLPLGGGKPYILHPHNQPHCGLLQHLNMNPLPFSSLWQQTDQAARQVMESDQAAMQVMQTDQAARQVMQTDQAARQIMQTDQAARQVMQTDQAARQVMQTDQAARQVMESDQAARQITESDLQGSATYPDMDPLPVSSLQQLKEQVVMQSTGNNLGKRMDTPFMNAWFRTTTDAKEMWEGVNHRQYHPQRGACKLDRSTRPQQHELHGLHNEAGHRFNGSVNLSGPHAESGIGYGRVALEDPGSYISRPEVSQTRLTSLQAAHDAQFLGQPGKQSVHEPSLLGGAAEQGPHCLNEMSAAHLGYYSSLESLYGIRPNSTPRAPCPHFQDMSLLHDQNLEASLHIYPSSPLIIGHHSSQHEEQEGQLSPQLQFQLQRLRMNSSDPTSGASELSRLKALHQAQCEDGVPHFEQSKMQFLQSMPQVQEQQRGIVMRGEDEEDMHGILDWLPRHRASSALGGPSGRAFPSVHDQHLAAAAAAAAELSSDSDRTAGVASGPSIRDQQHDVTSLLLASTQESASASQHFGLSAGPPNTHAEPLNNFEGLPMVLDAEGRSLLSPYASLESGLRCIEWEITNKVYADDNMLIQAPREDARCQ
ncbi:hypothetical protein CEUSTIGMA_g9864.t1 [Chlamydomonas eustigma]|uniref:Uncharacterized protein n=1 Tax=Chlamydomonas eustigma TaxID=1157962 RepID=A0A250XHE0_9CHLO|nr:hypothetical protein CEUSTIGMA_g9864.t1 [Chlamydomonas eustigma]|eukprot:GAX82436.1 hypothetical protein CEUSTIGMA_g9864.t1 [Chlamydomonas eustigma]